MSRLNYILWRHQTQSRTFAYIINSWYACLPLIWFGKTSEILPDPNYLQTLKASGKERERETSACILISKNIMYDTRRCFSCASAFARQSQIFDSIDTLHAFYRMPKCLN